MLNHEGHSSLFILHHSIFIFSVQKVHFDSRLASRFQNPWSVRLWMMRSLPMALPTGMMIESIDERHCRVRMPYRWWLRNPFRSLFWAVMGMAAELTTGALVYAYASGSGMKFILVGMEARFLKKVTGKSFYICEGGDTVRRHIENLGVVPDARFDLPVLVTNAEGEHMAEFVFTWQIKPKAGGHA